MKFLFKLSYGAAALACCLFVVDMFQRRSQLLAAEADLGTQLRAAKAKSAILFAQRQDAENARGKFEALARLEAQLNADRAAPKWATLLKVLISGHGADTQITRVTARTEEGSAGVCELQIAGRSAGRTHPRETAEEFRRALVAGLERACKPGSVAIDFASLDDAPGTPDVQQPHCTFVLSGKFTPGTRAQSHLSQR